MCEVRGMGRIVMCIFCTLARLYALEAKENAKDQDIHPRLWCLVSQTLEGVVPKSCHFSFLLLLDCVLVVQTDFR